MRVHRPAVLPTLFVLPSTILAILTVLVISTFLAPTLALAPSDDMAVPCFDADGDGFANCTVAGCDPTGFVCGDCDDAIFAVHPGAVESCNHRDDDCDGAVDEEFPTATTCECRHDRFPNATDRVGFSVTGPGDLDGDGIPDIAVGAPLDDLTGWDTGVVTLYSGRDRRVLWRTASTQSFLYLGNALEPIEDVNGDGVRDLLSGSPVTNSVVVISGASGAEIVRCVEPAGGGVGEYHGVATLADLTGDGVPEIAVGATTNNQRLHHQGKVTVFTYSRTTGTCTILQELWDPDGAIYDNLGYAVAGIGDVTGDGIPDVAAGAPGDDVVNDSNGSVLIFSGADGSFVRRLTDPLTGWRDNLGFDVHGIEDVNGDGVADIVASTERRNNWEGEVLIFNGATGTVLRRLTDASTTLGERVGGAFDVVGDVDGDGLDDIIAGARYAPVDGVIGSGRALVFSTGTGAILGILTNETNTLNALFGYDVAGVGDITGDGMPEFVAGAPFEQTAAGAEAGSFTVASIESICDADGVSPFAGDCDDTDSSLWGLPGEASDLNLGPAKSALGWNAPAEVGTSGAIVYDTLRSMSPTTFGSGSCLESGGLDLTTIDQENPPAGAGYFYLVRGVNACGAGGLGTWGVDARPREAPSCP